MWYSVCMSSSSGVGGIESVCLVVQVCMCMVYMYVYGSGVYVYGIYVCKT